MLQARRPLHQADGLDGAIINANRALSQAGPVFWVTFYGARPYSRNRSRDVVDDWQRP